LLQIAVRLKRYFTLQFQHIRERRMKFAFCK